MLPYVKPAETESLIKRSSPHAAGPIVSSSAKSLVSIENVTKTYPLNQCTVTALHDVSLSIAPNEFLALTGPSGSGKSTLLNLIGCIDRPTTGRIYLSGVCVTGLRAAEACALRSRQIGFVFQTFNLIPVFTASENVEYPLLLQKAPDAERRARVAEALGNVGLSHRGRHRPDLLSGGERQRVAVARAIVHRPALVLADEPTANLDTRNATNLIDLMRDFNAALGITFIFSTHDPRLLGRATRIVRLCDGRIEEDNKAD